MSGGSNKAIWEAGVVWGLLHYGNPEDFAWDVMSGISAGAINTGLMSVWATGDELAMSEHISETWASVVDIATLFTTWEGKEPTEKNIMDTLPNVLFEKNSLLDDENAVNWLASQIEPFGEMKRRWTTGAIDANTGDFV